MKKSQQKSRVQQPELVQAPKPEQHSHPGGLLKLNTEALNQMKATQKCDENDGDANVKQYVKNFRNLKYSSTRATNKEDAAASGLPQKMLFNPNNPDKPIYVADNSNHAKQKQQPQYSTQQLPQQQQKQRNMPEASQALSEHRDSKQAMVNAAEINKVHSLAKCMHYLEQSLNKLYDNFDSAQPLEKFTEAIDELRSKYEALCIEATFTHIETANTLNIDLNHWRCCFHRLIECLRKEYNHAKMQKQSNNPQQKLTSLLRAYLSDGFQFYSQLVEKLEKRYLRFRILDLVDLHLKSGPHAIKKALTVDMGIKSKNMKLAIMCINRCWISQGDLARYEEMIFANSSSSSSQQGTQQPRDFSMARMYYLQAKAIAPKSSRAYHQLAIIAVYTKRRLDACYYYFRCLQVSVPLTSVRQALNSLFDEARVRSDAIMKYIQAAIVSRQKKRSMSETRSSEISSQHRVETWFKPSFIRSAESTTTSSISPSNPKEVDTTVSSSGTDEDNENLTSDTSTDTIESAGDEADLEKAILLDEKKLSTSELNKRFMHNYLNTIGKLFTKVGMESYQEVCSRMLHEFSELLKRQAGSFGKMRLLQITVINLSLIDLVKTATGQNSSGHEMRSHLLQSAVQLSIDMFVIIVRCFNSLLRLAKDKRNTEYQHAWRPLFPSIKIFIDWMLCSSETWQPFPDHLPPELGPVLKRWQIISNMFNLIAKLKAGMKKVKSEAVGSRIKLEEDMELAGFVPLLGLPQDSTEMYKKEVSVVDLDEEFIEEVKDQKRIDKVCLFADYLCGLECPYLKYDVLNSCYKPLVSVASQQQQPDLEEVTSRKHRLSTNRSISMSSNCTVGSNTEFDHGQTGLESMSELSLDDELIELKEKRRLLKLKMEDQEKREKKHESLLDASAQRRLELEIRPKFIVPDTNCFVDHLSLIDKLLGTSYYIVIVPLLVINELDKLAKSILNYNDDSIEHAEYVQKSARQAIEYLTARFDKRERNLKAMTSQGSVLETITFRSEEVTGHGTTDELILGCCLHYCRDSAKNFMPNSKIDAIHFYREVVLLTDDRHLRMKAHTRNVPVKDIVKFAKWSELIPEDHHHHHHHQKHHQHQKTRHKHKY